ncbi:hypothetical protein GE09DRAFT_1054417 [Coniochaeta sp. 2T2.1]|nr:hypothetical protein GE09DRAFT_1054417 [Coniochaeta sp. 2T2.1]
MVYRNGSETRCSTVLLHHVKGSLDLPTAGAKCPEAPTPLTTTPHPVKLAVSNPQPNTMSPLINILLTTAGLALQANAATQMVTVGEGGALAFNPSEVKAAMGDTVTFTFAAGGNHSVVEGDFSNACQPAKSGGFFSGYMIDANSFSITVNTTDPIPFYCSQSIPPHCPFGMNAKTVGAPANVFGGTVGGSGSSTSGGSPAATTSPAGGNGGGGIYGGGGGSSPSPSGTAAAGGSNSGAGTLAASVGGIVAAIGFALYMA